MNVYILYSTQADIFYTGFTTDSVQDRLQRHLSGYYENKFTGKYDDWKIFLSIPCTSIKQARSVERHIKKMKSKVYILNLKKYPEMIEKLLEKYIR